MSKQEMTVRRNNNNNNNNSNGPRKLGSERKSPLSMVEEILQIIRYRKSLLLTIEDRNNTTNSDTNDNDTTTHESDYHDHCYRLRRQVFRGFEEAAETTTTTTTTTTRTTEYETRGEAASTTVSVTETDQAIESNNSNDNDNDNDNQGEKFSGQRFSFTEFLRLSRRVFATLSAMDYCERVPHNLVWSGFLNIRDIDNLEKTIRVMLVVDPRRWSMKEIRLWRNAATISGRSGVVTSTSTDHKQEPTIRAQVIPHNFLPVGPNRGRLVGVTKSDRATLRKISDGLNLSGLVGRYSCTISNTKTDTNTTANGNHNNDTTNNNDSNHSIGQFTVKLVAFDFAQQKLDSVFRGREPGGIVLGEEKKAMKLDLESNKCEGVGDDDGYTHEQYCKDVNSDNNSLLCCWSHEFLWEDSRLFRMETSLALRDAMSEYVLSESRIS